MGKKEEETGNWFEVDERFETVMGEVMMTLANLDLLVIMPGGEDGEIEQELFVDAVWVFFEAYLKELGYSSQGEENYLRFSEIQQKLWEIFVDKQKFGMEVGKDWQQFFGDSRIMPEKARWFNSVMRNVGHATSSPGIRNAMEKYYRSEDYLFDYNLMLDTFGGKALKLPEFKRHESQFSGNVREFVKAKIARILSEAKIIDLG